MSRRIVIRADAGPLEGVGHVMRVLSLAEELKRRDYEIVLQTAPSGISWLQERIRATGVRVENANSGVLDINEILKLEPDVCVIDSYRFDSGSASALGGLIPLVMICDADTRGVNASLYVDHNLAAESNFWPSDISGRILAGSDYAITRDEVLLVRQARLSPREDLSQRLKIRCVAGGADFNETSVIFAQVLIESGVNADVLFVTDEEQERAILSLGWGHETLPTFLRPTSDLLRILVDADLVLSAAGTTAWDLMTMGIPAGLTAVVPNQESSLRAIEESAIAVSLGTLVEMRTDPTRAIDAVSLLAGDRDLRARLSARATSIFDGLGRVRIADRIDRIVKS